MQGEGQEEQAEGQEGERKGKIMKRIKSMPGIRNILNKNIVKPRYSVFQGTGHNYALN